MAGSGSITQLPSRLGPLSVRTTLTKINIPARISSSAAHGKPRSFTGSGRLGTGSPFRSFGAALQQLVDASIATCVIRLWAMLQDTSLGCERRRLALGVAMRGRGDHIRQKQHSLCVDTICSNWARANAGPTWSSKGATRPHEQPGLSPICIDCFFPLPSADSVAMEEDWAGSAGEAACRPVPIASLLRGLLIGLLACVLRHMRTFGVRGVTGTLGCT
jgi:hypothetical protein